MTARSNFLYNSLSNDWNMTYDCQGSFPLQFLIKINEIWYLTVRGHFLYNSLATSLKYYLWVLGAISFTIHDTCLLGASCFIIPYRNHWNMTCDCFLYNSLPTSLKYCLWVLGVISFTIHDTRLLGASCFIIPYWNHWNMTYDCFLYNSLPTSLKYYWWVLGAISFTIHDTWLLGHFPLHFLIKIFEIWPMTAMSHSLHNSLSKSMKYETWLLGAISFTTLHQTYWKMTHDP